MAAGERLRVGAIIAYQSSWSRRRLASSASSSSRLFFTEEDGCLALFELLPAHRALATSARLDKLALMNAIWRYYPDYALLHNLREQQGLNDMLGLIMNDAGIECELSGSPKNMVALSDGAGMEYVRW